MSELSVRQFLHNDGSSLTLGYDKSEADKVIAEKDAEIARLKENQRWRKFIEEKPEHHQWVEVFCPNHSKYKAEIEIRRWDEGLKFDVENQELYTKWKPLPAEPKEEK